MRALNRTSLAKKYPGKWLAFKSDRKTVVGTGNSVTQALKAARRSGVDRPIVTRMPRCIRGFVGGCRRCPR
jgi:hypothetical protein